jgi:hypothetical protein
MAPRLALSLVSFLAFAAFGWAHGAELGELRVGSHIGQPLVADIELTALEDQAAPVEVRLASADVYRGANVAMPPVLSSLTMSVMRRDGRQFLHITSLKPVESEHLHVYLELADGSHRSVRLATLWLTPDPRPAPPPPEPVRAAEPMPERAVTQPPAAAVKPASMPAVKPAPVPAVVAPPVPLRAVRAVTAPPKVPPPPRAERPAACLPQPVSRETDVCIALDHKNAQLKSQIVGLEDKVKVLQVAMGAATPAVAAKPKPKLAAAAAPVPRKPKQLPESEAGRPWLWIGAAVAAVLALCGGAVVGVRRRNARNAKDAKRAVPVSPAVMTGVKSRLMPP